MLIDITVHHEDGSTTIEQREVPDDWNDPAPLPPESELKYTQEERTAFLEGLMEGLGYDSEG